MLQFLKNMVECAEGSTIYPMQNFRSVNMYPEGKCIGYMDIILVRKRKLCFDEETEEIKYELEVYRNFEKIYKIIS